MIQGVAIGPTVRNGIGHARTNSHTCARSTTTRYGRPLWTRSSGPALRRHYRRARPGTHVIFASPSTTTTTASSTLAHNHCFRTTSLVSGTDQVPGLSPGTMKTFATPSTASRPFSTSLTCATSSSPRTTRPSKGTPKLMEGEVVYRRDGEKIVPVPKTTATPAVSSLFQAFEEKMEKDHIESRAVLDSGKNGSESVKVSLEDQDNTVYLQSLSAHDMVPPEGILEHCMTTENLKVTRDEIVQLVTPVVEVLPLDEKDPIRVKVEQEFLKECKKKGIRPALLGEWCFQYTKVGAPLALDLFRLSMDQGDTIANYSYAAMLYRGAKGVPADRIKARAILEALATNNNKGLQHPGSFPPAMVAMAGIYAREEKNFELAEKYYLRAAQMGMIEAQLALGRMYLNGELAYNLSKAKLCFQVATESKHATDKTHAEAHFMLGSLELKMNKPDLKRSFQHFQKAASKGLPEAQYNVGRAYFVGMGVPKNEALAVEYWKMSAQQGFGLAQLSLGAYFFQDEVPQEQILPGSETSSGDHSTAVKHVWDPSKKDLLHAQKWFTLASRRPGELGIEGKRLKGKVEEAMRKGKGAKDGRMCAIM